MAFSLTKSRPFRSLGLYKSSGKHAAPKGGTPEPRSADEAQPRQHRPSHAATMPRLTGPQAGADQPADADRQAGADQQAA